MFYKFPLYTKFRFFRQGAELGQAFSFSSDLEKIGLEWDISIKNGTYVDVISEPLQINRKLYGTISVVKIRADVAQDYHTIIKEFWVPVHSIIKLDNNEVENSKFEN